MREATKRVIMAYLQLMVYDCKRAPAYYLKQAKAFRKLDLRQVFDNAASIMGETYESDEVHAYLESLEAWFDALGRKLA
jgi:hypothetical protein